MGFARRERFPWQLRSRRLSLGERTLVMGIVNATPDSFSDGGHYDPVAHGLRLLEEGADILDLGGESTRPGGAGEVSGEEEQSRVLPVIKALAKAGAVVSVDTYRASTARLAIEAGAEIVNDVSGLLWDPEMASTCRALGCGVVVMHTRGKPSEWATLPPMTAIVPTVVRELQQRIAESGIARDRLIVDPGFGFGKRGEENFTLMAGLEGLKEIGLPIMAGASRKGFLGGEVRDREFATVAMHTAAILSGAHVIRVHNVKAAVQGALIADAILLGL
ncbi:dihydropteroate synthase [Terriglobus albidus]|uniref:Dihydropteroate synthase n=1 Tax=Terriglobus albidus TaxID=1592106 RepID=A0A5B9E765_9BACT|nr:dihydropteroate synthase [Terriglobus albidus]